MSLTPPAAILRTATKALARHSSVGAQPAEVVHGLNLTMTDLAEVTERVITLATHAHYAASITAVDQATPGHKPGQNAPSGTVAGLLTNAAEHLFDARTPARHTRQMLLRTADTLASASTWLKPSRSRRRNAGPPRPRPAQDCLAVLSPHTCEHIHHALTSPANLSGAVHGLAELALRIHLAIDSAQRDLDRQLDELEHEGADPRSLAAVADAATQLHHGRKASRYAHHTLLEAGGDTFSACNRLAALGLDPATPITEAHQPPPGQ